MGIENIADSWYHEQMGMNWVILMDDYSDTLQGFDDEDIEWEDMESDIITNSGKKIGKRCMNIFGRQLCLCQFLYFIGAETEKQCPKKTTGKKKKKKKKK